MSQFDNLREDASFADETPSRSMEESAPPPRSGGRLLGMTPIQRFVIVFLLMITVCVLGTMCLLITGKIGLGL